MKATDNLYGQTEVEVFDMNQGGDKPRIHEVVIRADKDGRVLETKPYALFRMTKTVMPIEHGLKFLKDPSFRVQTLGGVPLEPLRESQVQGQALKLADDEVVATYEELSRDALYKRCKVQAGSEEVHADATSEQLVLFLRKRRGMQIGEARNTSAEALAAGGAPGDALSDAESKNLIDKDNVTGSMIDNVNSNNDAADLARAQQPQMRRGSALDGVRAG